MSAEAIAASLADAAERLALELAPDHLARLGAYAALVHKWQRICNLTAAPTPLAFAREHIVDCLAVLPHVPAGHLLDVGSGAGLPGIVVAICEPTRPVTLLEPRARRARFLTQARIELGLDEVAIETTRVERHRPACAYAAVIARAFGPLDRLLQATRALQQPGTRLLVMKGRLDADEIARSGVPAAALEVLPLSVPGFADRHLVVVDCARLADAPPSAGEAP